MTYADHPLAGIFSADDLERLAQGKRLVSDRPADPLVVRLLTGPGYESDPLLLCLREWFLQAASHSRDVETYYRQQLRSGAGSIKAFYQPIGELRTAHFFERHQQLGLTHIPVDPKGGRRTPEFEVSTEGVTILVEVKTIGDHPWAGSGGFIGAVPTRARTIRNDIRRALGQLDKDGHNLLMIIDQERVPIPPHDVLDAMYGTEYLSIPYGPDGSPGAARLQRDRDGRLGPKSATRVGVIGVLRMSSAEPDVYFVHNVHAPKPIPAGLLDPWPQLVRGLVPRNSAADYWR